MPGPPGGAPPGAGPMAHRQAMTGGQGEGLPPEFQRMGGMIHVIGRMGEAVFNARIAGVIAVSALKDEVHLKTADKIEMLEDLLKDVKTQGLRNALHLALKDLYKAQGDDAKMVEHLKAMVIENDQALQACGGDKKPGEE